VNWYKKYSASQPQLENALTNSLLKTYNSLMDIHYEVQNIFPLIGFVNERELNTIIEKAKINALKQLMQSTLSPSQEYFLDELYKTINGNGQPKSKDNEQLNPENVQTDEVQDAQPVLPLESSQPENY